MKTCTVSIHETAGWSPSDQFCILVNVNQPDEHQLTDGMTKAMVQIAIENIHKTHRDWFLDRGYTTLKVRIFGRGTTYLLREVKEFCPVEDT